MRTPPHLPARSRRDHTDHVRRHPYGLHEVPAQAPPRGTLDLPPIDPAPEPGDHAERRLLEIREMSNQAIGSIDDLLQHTV
ncbi:hypothetical protein SAMN05444920_110249 [Nonomuraea solani]|uniref:Uncharacterized protein n=1 Tax=Nonomuraea solani TaxID=1144553 RepID=A0A1H6EH57_9ACTN|nr:hypothetical protein [Nonomuraea solani]SEG97170.1 hypothetical protein SAMN05444920_110249 [Nonomuraea solani]